MKVFITTDVLACGIVVRDAVPAFDGDPRNIMIGRYRWRIGTDVFASESSVFVDVRRKIRSEREEIAGRLLKLAAIERGLAEGRLPMAPKRGGNAC
jgi:hypothetical protein